MFKQFKAECKKEMYLRGWGNRDLANATGYKKSTIDRFFMAADSRGESLEVATALSKCLGVKLN